MDTNTAAWLDGLPPALAPQRIVLRRLLATVERKPQWRPLELSSSVARGAGDEYSDLDLGLGVSGDAWPQALAMIPPLVTGLGEAADMLPALPHPWLQPRSQRP